MELLSEDLLSGMTLRTKWGIHAGRTGLYHCCCNVDEESRFAVFRGWILWACLWEVQLDALEYA